MYCFALLFQLFIRTVRQIICPHKQVLIVLAYLSRMISGDSGHSVNEVKQTSPLYIRIQLEAHVTPFELDLLNAANKD